MEPQLNGDALVRAYTETEDPAYLENIRARYATSRYNLNRVWKYVSPGNRLLDVGSYCGAFMKIAASRGLEVTGVEPSQWAAAMSKQVIEAPVIQGTLENVPMEKGLFDIITLWDVLEHFEDPASELRKISNLLTPDGYFFFFNPHGRQLVPSDDRQILALVHGHASLLFHDADHLRPP
jgi:2-polyprenyl-3-methyl-5-hydroxy-6-metoxy-1,4-benzoquinol methylase